MTIRLKNYIVIDHIANGGFGSIFRAVHERTLTRRIVVLKVIKKEFSENQDFKTAFINEIKASFPLTHPNIAQIYEYGEKDGRLYYILEFVQGFNIRQMIKKAIKLKMTIPVPFVIHLMIEACKGLHFAHTFTDKLTGEPYNIVHRDISPQNIMVSYDGQVKVIDFGIAKARTNVEETKKGIFKGKPSYMAPEYIRSGHYDHRFDQFSLGILFWELVTNERLFKAPTPMEIVKKIIRCEVPLPRFHNEEITHELQEVILKMLHSNYRKRYPNLNEVEASLSKILHTQYSDFTSASFKNFIADLFKSEIKWEFARTRRLADRALEKRMEDWDRKGMIKKAQ